MNFFFVSHVFTLHRLFQVRHYQCLFFVLFEIFSQPPPSNFFWHRVRFQQHFQRAGFRVAKRVINCLLLPLLLLLFFKSLYLWLLPRLFADNSTIVHISIDSDKRKRINIVAKRNWSYFKVNSTKFDIVSMRVIELFFWLVGRLVYVRFMQRRTSPTTPIPIFGSNALPFYGVRLRLWWIENCWK